jgi:predicted transcriptional regulator
MVKPRAKYRTKSDIMAQIISVAKDMPVTKTRISYDCFLSYDYLNECLNILIKSGLLSNDDKITNTYTATEKGLHYLELCTSLYR